MENYNINYLKEFIRRLVIEYEVEKELERNRETIEKEVDKIARELAENMVNRTLEMKDIKLDDDQKRECIEKVMQKVKEDFGLNQVEEYIYRKATNIWYPKEKLEEGEREIAKILYEIASILKKRKEIVEVRERIIDELTKIVEKEGIDKLKDLDELLRRATKNVLPTPEDYRRFRENEIKYLKEYIEKVVKNNYLKLCKYMGIEMDELSKQAYSKVADFIKTLYQQDIDEEIKEIYGNNKGKNMWGLYTDIGYI